LFWHLVPSFHKCSHRQNALWLFEFSISGKQYEVNFDAHVGQQVKELAAQRVLRVEREILKNFDF
jgi:hypothetical protein